MKHKHRTESINCSSFFTRTEQSASRRTTLTTADSDDPSCELLLLLLLVLRGYQASVTHDALCISDNFLQCVLVVQATPTQVIATCTGHRHRTAAHRGRIILSTLVSLPSLDSRAASSSSPLRSIRGRLQTSGEFYPCRFINITRKPS